MSESVHYERGASPRWMIFEDKVDTGLMSVGAREEVVVDSVHGCGETRDAIPGAGRLGL